MSTEPLTDEEIAYVNHLWNDQPWPAAEVVAEVVPRLLATVRQRTQERDAWIEETRRLRRIEAALAQINMDSGEPG